jgi:ribose transport system permease protein
MTDVRGSEIREAIAGPPAAAPAPAAATSPALARVKAWTKSDGAPIWIATVALFALSAVIAGNSLNAASLESTFAFGGILAVAAVGQTLVVQQRGMDLSVAGNITLCALVLPIYMTRSGAPLAGGLAAVVVTAIVIGLVNGLLVTKVGITPLIATLAVNSLLLGATLSYTHGIPSAAAPESLQGFATSKVLGVSALLWVAAAVAIALTLAMTRTVIGRRFVAVGANPAAARAAGVAVDRYVIAAYVVGSLCFALAAVLLISYLGSATVRIGQDYLFPTIAAVVVGGTSFAGGRGNIVASAVAALFLTQLVQMLLTLGAPSSTQYLVQAGAIAVAAALRSLTRR